MKSLNKLTLCAISLILLLHIAPSDELKILGVFPITSKSHFNMCEKIMQALAEKGHQVDVYSHFPQKKSLPNYTDFELVDPDMGNSVNNVSFEYARTIAGSMSISTIVTIAGSPVCKQLELPVFQELLQKTRDNHNYDLVIVDTFVASCHLAWGRYLNIPMIGVYTILTDWMDDSFGIPSHPIAYPSFFTKNVGTSNFFERLQNLLLSTYVKFAFRYYVRDQNELVEKYFGPNYPDVVELEKDLSLVLLNHHNAINGIRPLPPAVIPVAGLHIKDNNEKMPQVVQKFLDESKDGFIYVSFGSMLRIETLPKPVLDIFYKTFKKIAPVRVLMKIAKPEELPPGLPTNVITYHWLPQIQVLKHKNVKAYVTHGGIMGSQEAIYYNVPIIGFPVFGDQHYNLASFVKNNIGIKLNINELTEEILMNAVTEILKNPLYKKNVEKMGKLFRDAPISPIDSAVFWTEYIARHGKNALRSPLVDMPWWQSSLLDVYGFILTILLIVLYVFKLVLKKLINLILPKQQKHKTKVKKN